MKNDEGVTSHLGLEFTELTPERVVATMPVDGRHHQPFGYLHGGVSVVLAESVASIGGFLNCPPGKVAFGAEINASHVRPKRSGTLTAVGIPAHLGDRKSTRLNSSHANISYAVFCLKKKLTTTQLHFNYPQYPQSPLSHANTHT